MVAGIIIIDVDDDDDDEEEAFRPTRQFTIDRMSENALEYPLRHSGVIVPREEAAVAVVAPSARATSFNPSSKDVSSDKAAAALVPLEVVVDGAAAAVVVVVVMVAKRTSIDVK